MHLDIQALSSRIYYSVVICLMAQFIEFDVQTIIRLIVPALVDITYLALN